MIFIFSSVTFCGIHRPPSSTVGDVWGLSFLLQGPASLLPHYLRTSKHSHHEVPLGCPFYFPDNGKMTHPEVTSSGWVGVIQSTGISRGISPPP